MGYYNNLMLRAIEACGEDAKEGVRSDPIKTAQAIERAEKMAAYAGLNRLNEWANFENDGERVVIRYYYMTATGDVFSCVPAGLDDARRQRDEWLKVQS